MKTSLQMAQETRMRPIGDVAADAGLLPEEVEPYGRHRAKVDYEAVLHRLKDRPDGKLVVVTAITPTKAGEGKTTSAIGLTEGMGRIGKNAIYAVREPSVGPVFGTKGGGAGGGRAQILPMEEINLHLNGDLHAVTTANNLLAAALDASYYWDNPLAINPATITWPRCIDMNDRPLRETVIGLGDRFRGGVREATFVITAASEVMAILALASDLKDLRARLGRIVVAENRSGEPVTAEDLKAAGAMTVVMRDALRPNLVQTMEGQPVLIHAGPFGNIAHGNNSIIADRVALKLADIVVTEAGFGADLGFEKFCHIVARLGGFRPDAAMLVATVRAVKSHGGVAFEALGGEDLDALKRGAENVAAHIDIVRAFGLPCVVAINPFPSDTPAEIALLGDLAREMGAESVVVNDGYSRGGEGATEVAAAVADACDRPNHFAPINTPETPIREQIEAIATRVYGAAGVQFSPQAEREIARMHAIGLGQAPVCMAKSQMSISHDPELLGRPTGFTLPVRQIVPSVGAGFVVALCGDMQRMPGFGRVPAFTGVDIDEDGRTVGLF